MQGEKKQISVLPIVTTSASLRSRRKTERMVSEKSNAKCVVGTPSAFISSSLVEHSEGDNKRLLPSHSLLGCFD